MTLDLWMLVASVALTWALAAGAATPTLLAYPKWALWNRDTHRDLPTGWPARLRRTSVNMNENLPLFATLTLVVHVTGAASDTTATGAQMFFWSRVAHAALYTAGVPYLRTVAWAISVFGMLIVGEALL